MQKIKDNDYENAINIKNLSFSYGDNHVLKKIDIDIPKGKITTILGANGCGKSTLFFLMTKELKADSGSILIYDKSIEEIPIKDFAKKVSVVQQNNTYIGGITVKELVSLGRVPYRKFFGFRSKEDDDKIDWAIEITGLNDLKDRDVSKLSGGQRQRAWIAMALAQGTDILFLDEPTTFLDIKFQLEILSLIKKLNEEFKITIVMVLHDINHAIHYSDKIIGLKNGNVEFEGNPFDVINEFNIESIYGINLRVIEVDGDKLVLNI